LLRSMRAPLLVRETASRTKASARGWQVRLSEIETVCVPPPPPYCCPYPCPYCTLVSRSTERGERGGKEPRATLFEAVALERRVRLVRGEGRGVST
jgi:hypothetical protein